MKRLSVPVLCAALLAVTSPAVAADNASPFGLNIHTPVGQSLTDIMNRSQAAGLGWVNVVFIWPYIEGQQGALDFSAIDAIVAAARARHLSMMGTLLFTPAWATSSPSWTGVPDQNAWATFCTTAASRYAGVIDNWQIWNEPNLTEFWAGTRQQYISGLLIPGADAIHAANPAAKVGGPALATLDSADWYDWLNDVLAEAGSHLDFVTHHTYDTSGSSGVTSKLNASTIFGTAPPLWGLVTPSVREVLQYAGWFGKPFWLTETGWESSATGGEPQQAADYTGMLSDWFTGMKGQSWIDRIFFYEAEDPTGAPNTTWGILRADGTPKLAYFAYQAFIGNQQPPPTDGAKLISSTIPTSMETTEPLTVSLTFKNTGTSTWTAVDNYKLGAVSNHDSFAAPRQLLAPSDAIAPGQERTFTFPYQAPATAGPYLTQWQMLREGIDWFGDQASTTVSVTTAPPLAARTLNLLASRFGVSVSWHDPQSGQAGFGRTVPDGDQSGLIWFFTASSTELVVKALDGRAVNDRFWFFYGALSDVEYWISVTDHRTSAVKTYYNPPGNLCGQADTSAFTPGAAAAAVLEVPGPAAVSAHAGAGRWISVPLGDSSSPPADASGTCVPSAGVLCFLSNRFAVTTSWSLPGGTAGVGTGTSISDETGTFWFFDPANVELVVKVLDGRAVNGKFWFFYGALSDVEYTITLTDTVTGASKQYRNAQGNFCGLGDTSALN